MNERFKLTLKTTILKEQITLIKEKTNIVIIKEVGSRLAGIIGIIK